MKKLGIKNDELGQTGNKNFPFNKNDQDNSDGLGGN